MTPARISARRSRERTVLTKRLRRRVCGRCHVDRVTGLAERVHRDRASKLRGLAAEAEHLLLYGVVEVTLIVSRPSSVGSSSTRRSPAQPRASRCTRSRAASPRRRSSPLLAGDARAAGAGRGGHFSASSRESRVAGAIHIRPRRQASPQRIARRVLTEGAAARGCSRRQRAWRSAACRGVGGSAAAGQPARRHARLDKQRAGARRLTGRGRRPASPCASCRPARASPACRPARIRSARPCSSPATESAPATGPRAREEPRRPATWSVRKLGLTIEPRLSTVVGIGRRAALLADRREERAPDRLAGRRAAQPALDPQRDAANGALPHERIEAREARSESRLSTVLVDEELEASIREPRDACRRRGERGRRLPWARGRSRRPGRRWPSQRPGPERSDGVRTLARRRHERGRGVADTRPGRGELQPLALRQRER